MTYYEENKEYALNNAVQYYHENKEKRKQYNKYYYELHKEAIKAKQRAKPKKVTKITKEKRNIYNSK